MSLTLLWTATFLLALGGPVLSFTSYANEFVDPDFVLAKKFPISTVMAQKTILEWAEELAAKGPWSVANKTYAPPSGNKHDYMSWGPYWWPDCSSVENSTELTPQQIWTTCPYIVKDGQVNPDGRLVDDVGDFDSMANAVLYDALAWTIDGASVYAARVATYISTWFLDDATYMAPNLNYAQMQRGPKGQNGTHTGILDLKCMTKIVSGVLILRGGKAPGWASDVDAGLVNWAKEYITWLTSAPTALEEKAAANNHGTFYYNQLAALQILVGDTAGAKQTIEEYFTTQFEWQIAANGDQPLETARTRPYHYRAYNLAAMITNAKLGQYVGYNAWNLTTSNGTTIKDALAYAITQNPGHEAAGDLWQPLVAAGAVYGDPDATLAAFMRTHAGAAYPSDAQFLWNQPFSDLGLVNATDTKGHRVGAEGRKGAKGRKNGATAGGAGGWGVLGVVVAGIGALLLGA